MTLLELAQTCPIFEGIGENDLRQILTCTGAALCKYDKGETIDAYGNPYPRLGIAVKGKIVVTWSDPAGNRVILSSVESKGIFGLLTAMPDAGYEGTAIVAAEKSEAIMLDEKKFLNGCRESCPWHRRMLQNTVVALAQRNMVLNRKQCHMAQHSLRKKLSSYLLEVYAAQHSASLLLPMNRQELADFLGVDRSAMCAELSRMQRDGLLTYSRQQVTLGDAMLEGE